jgi:hypothetical protein
MPRTRQAMARIVCMMVAVGCAVASARPGAEVEGAEIGSTLSARCADADLSALTSVVYVSPQGSDGASCGATSAAPCRTVQQGIHRCGPDCGVLVRHGLYPLSATIQLKEGVSVYGGCVFDGTITRPYRSTLQAPPDGTPAINASGVNTPTTLYGLVVLGSDATTPGQASIAMTVSSSSGLTLHHNVLVAGRGADGAPGVQPAQADRGEDGKGAGGDGGRACPSAPVPGAGKGGSGGPEQTFSVKGCFLACVCTSNGFSSGDDGSESEAVEGGTGGGAGGDGCGCSAAPGHDGVPDGNRGQPGATGPCATQGGSASSNIWGTFSVGKWTPTSGGAGGAGEVGSGGGGGGAGGMALITHVSSDPSTYPGLAGGGGGGGGCGGDGGGGGGQGGASIPLVLVASRATLIQNSFIPGPGGKGATGGRGGAGGTGGDGGPGDIGHYHKIEQVGFCEADVPGSGGPGGGGGQGGAGAGGAGGNGGPSIGIALVGGSPAPANDTGIYAGTAGAGGSRGPGGQNASGQCQGAAGALGATGGSGPWHVF